MPESESKATVGEAIAEGVFAPPRIAYKHFSLVALCLRASRFETDEHLRERVGAERVGRQWLVRESELEARGFAFQTSRILATDETDLSTSPDDLIGNGTPGPRLRSIYLGSGPAIARGTILVEIDGIYGPLESANDLHAAAGALWSSVPESSGVREAQLIVRGLLRATGLIYPGAFSAQDIADALWSREIRIQSV